MEIEYARFKIEVPEETSQYVDNAIDIFAAMEQRDIQAPIYDYSVKSDRQIDSLSINEKRFGALFAAILMSNNDVKGTILSYFKQDDILKYFHLSDNNIKKLSNEERSVYFDRHFKPLFHRIKDFYFGGYGIIYNSRFVPEFIISYLADSYEGTIYNNREFYNQREFGESCIIDWIYREYGVIDDFQHAYNHDSFCWIKHLLNNKMDNQVNNKRPLPSKDNYQKQKRRGNLLFFPGCR